MTIIYRPRKVDSNQQAIINAFEKAGYHVVDLSAVGAGCPDLLISKLDRAFFVEVKNKEGRNRFTKPQIEFISRTDITTYLAHSVDDVIDIIDRRKKPIN